MLHQNVDVAQHLLQMSPVKTSLNDFSTNRIKFIFTTGYITSLQKCRSIGDNAKYSSPLS